MNIKDAKRNFVTDTAIDLFLKKSVSSVTIKDVASASGLGEATIYRYFSGKSGLAVACAMKLQMQVGKMFIESDNSKSGFERLEGFYSAYIKMFISHPELYRFLNEFDAYCINEGVEDLDEYAGNMDLFKEAYTDAYSAGVRDGSVKAVDDIEEFYYSTTHSMLALCKTLASGDGMLPQDRKSNKLREVETLRDIILSSLKK